MAISRHGSRHIIERGANLFPLYLKSAASLFNQDAPGEPVANLSDRATEYLAGLGADAAALFYHTLAVLHAPAYRDENSGALRQDWPRVPLPTSVEALQTSAALGRQLAALLDPERDVLGVSSDPPRPELRTIGVLSKVGSASISVAAGDLAITANWGFAGRGGITMPARGKLAERAPSDDERAAWGKHLRHISQRQRLLAQRARAGVGIHDRRLPGAEKVALVPRARPAGARADGRRNALRRPGGAAHRGDPAAGAAARRQLPARVCGHGALGVATRSCGRVGAFAQG